jgi:hypothetical protein
LTNRDDPVERFIREMKQHIDAYCREVPFGERPDYVQELIASVQSAYEKLEMRAEYRLDYTQAKPNRFAARPTPSPGLVPGAKCLDFKPDHNGECLNCDEWADAHDLPEEGK